MINQIRKSNIYIIGVSKSEKREKRGEIILKRKDWGFSDLMKGINVQFQESEVPSRKNIKKSTLGHVIMRTSKIEIILRVTREKEINY